MSREQLSVRCIPRSLVFVIAVGVLLIGVATAQAASGANPAAAFASNGVSASVRAVQPAVSGLFQVHTPRVWMDEVGEAGAPGGNGVPDFLDSWEAFSARTSSAILRNGYAFKTIDGLGHDVLYAGVQRASSGGPSSVVLEFSQKTGERTLGDLRISVEIDAAGGVSTARFETFAGEAKGASKFLPIALFSGEGCNDVGSACLVANGALLEFGYNVTAFGKPEKEFFGIRITTPEDSVVGVFSVNPVTLPAVTCPSNLRSCTANDVVTTVKAVSIPGNAVCESANTGTIPLRITNSYTTTASQRFDLGLFVSGDGGTVQEPSSAVTCLGAAAQAGEGDNLAYPDADTDLFLSLDPSGHSLTPSTTDTCGDLSSTTGSVDWTVDVTVGCNIINNELVIPSCRVWEQNANHKTSCTTLQQAGTGSKCDCSNLVVTPQINPCAAAVCNDGNACTVDHCRVVGTVPNATAECYTTPDTGAVCSDGDACTTGETCQSNGQCGGGAPVTCSDSNACTDDSCDATTGCVYTNNSAPCDDNTVCNGREVCSGGTCGTGAPLVCNDRNDCTDDTCSATAGCVYTNNSAPCDDNTVCNGREVCSGGACGTGTPLVCNDQNVCTDDTCNATSGCVYTNNTGPCSDQNACTGPDVCKDGACVPGDPVIISEP